MYKLKFNSGFEMEVKRPYKPAVGLESVKAESPSVMHVSKEKQEKESSVVKERGIKMTVPLNGFQVIETDHTIKYLAYPGAVSEVEILGTQIVMIPQQSKVLAQGNAMSAFPMTMATLQVKELGGRVVTVPLSGDCDLFWEEPTKLQGKERV